MSDLVLISGICLSGVAIFICLLFIPHDLDKKSKRRFEVQRVVDKYKNIGVEIAESANKFGYGAPIKESIPWEEQLEITRRYRMEPFRTRAKRVMYDTGASSYTTVFFPSVNYICDYEENMKSIIEVAKELGYYVKEVLNRPPTPGDVSPTWKVTYVFERMIEAKKQPVKKKA